MYDLLHNFEFRIDKDISVAILSLKTSLAEVCKSTIGQPMETLKASSIYARGVFSPSSQLESIQLCRRKTYVKVICNGYVLMKKAFMCEDGEVIGHTILADGRGSHIP